MQAVNFGEKLSEINELWSPRIVASMNDHELKLTRIQGEFEWHSHSDTDEVFIVLSGEMLMDFRDSPVPLKKGEMIVVPAGTEHRPVADEECQILLIEKKRTSNSGDQPGTRAGTVGSWA
jgi:mannose-6-phosphate isomerase-like protein (cupin superfamily)